MPCFDLFQPSLAELLLTTFRLVLAPVVVALITIAFGWFVGLSANPGAVGLPLDDAWIHQVYARSLSQGGLFEYNAGQTSSGCTSPLWALALSTVQLASGSDAQRAVYGTHALGVFLHLATVILSTHLALRIVAKKRTAALLGTLVAVAYPSALASFSGMEVALTAMLLVLASDRWIARKWWSAGVALGLALWSRPETGACAAVLVSLAATRERTWKPIVQLGLPWTLALAAWMWLNVIGGGSVMPATYEAKSALDTGAMFSRLWVAITQIFDDVSPFAFGLGWVAMLGAAFDRRWSTAAPAVVGLSFVVANVAVIDPVDPEAFYHARYLLPAAPLLILAAGTGVDSAARRFLAGRKEIGVVVLLTIGITQTTFGMREASHHFHNDVRNINEVQRAIGDWLGSSLPKSARIATSDAGAVRYFSDLPTIDVLGLNTPQMLNPDADFLRKHPVDALVFLPAWFRPLNPESLEVIHQARTEDYTVTSNPGMATQVVARATPRQGPESVVAVRFVGFRPFELLFRAPPSRANPSSDAP